MLTDYVANKLLDKVVGKDTSSSFPTGSYFALSTSTPTKTGTNVSEPPTAAGYKRIAIRAYDRMSSASHSTITNDQDIIYFPEVTGDGEDPWGTITHICIYTSASGSNYLLAYAPICDENGDPTTITPQKGQLPIIRLNQFKLFVDKEPESGE